MTAVNVLVAAGPINLVLPMPHLANGVAFLMATLLSYTINMQWNFSSTLHRENLACFVLVSGIGLGLSVRLSGIAQHLQFHYA